MVVRRKIVLLMKFLLAGKRCFQNCPQVLSPGRQVALKTTLYSLNNVKNSAHESISI
ncbi:hypothetical protein DSECCO2_383540 [anaerobic digester metagenome]|jgi:hypothetical protein